MKVTAKNVQFTCSDGTNKDAYLCQPTLSGRYPGIIVIQEIFGLNNQIRGVAKRYSENGFVANCSKPVR